MTGHLEALQVVTLADEGFALPLAVFARTLLDHLAAGQPVALTVLDGGLTPATRDALRESFREDPRLTLAFQIPSFGGAPALSRAGRIPHLTYARLAAVDALPETCDRVLVLDADQLVLTDLTRLRDLPFQGAAALAARDAFIPFVSSPNGLTRWAELGFARDDPFFGAAVLVLDARVWRDEGLSAKTLAWASLHAGVLNTYDQDAFNAVLAGRIGELDSRWQVQPRVLSLSPRVTPHLGPADRARQLEDPWVVHFSGRLKPWLYRGRNRFDELFREALSRTAFRGRLDCSGLRALAYRLYDGPVRRVVYPLEVLVEGAVRRARRRSRPPV